MIRQRDKFSLSEYFYAINFDSFRHTMRAGEGQSTLDQVLVDAIWFKKKDGVLAVCKGSLWGMDRELNTPEDFITKFDGRYGGSTHFKWNGTEMWSSDNHFLRMVEAHRELDPILNDFPNIPAGYTGWYSIK